MLKISSHNRVVELQQWIDHILFAVGHRDAFVTDNSSLYDFCPEGTSIEDFCKNVSKKLLYFPLDLNDLNICNIAEGLKNRPAVFLVFAGTYQDGRSLLGIYREEKDALSHAYAMVHRSNLFWKKNEISFTRDVNPNYFVSYMVTDGAKVPMRFIRVEKCLTETPNIGFDTMDGFWDD